MSLSTLQHKFLPLIEATLQEHLGSSNFSNRSDLKAIIAYQMGWSENGGQGKRIRPLLLLLCTKALNSDIANALPAAVSIEFLHNFTLIHDDIEDRSPLRHGQPTVWKKWGVPQAINAGDALFSIAQMSILKLRETCHETIAAESAYRLNHTCLQLTEGQHMDMSFENDENILVNDYLEMIKMKTAALISLSTSLSGLISEQNNSVQQDLAGFGESLGMAFQIKDDGLGVWGNPEITGKSASSDLQTRKKTLPILYGLEHSSEFQNMWGKETVNAEEITHMVDLLEDCGAKVYVQSKTATYTEKALSYLNKIFPQKNEASQALFELSEQLLTRNI